MPYDPSLDPAIKQLLDQQAEIQAKLAALLPQKYGPNIKVELDMLRHKHRALRAYAEDNCEMPCQLLFPAIVTCHRIVLSTVPYLFSPPFVLVFSFHGCSTIPRRYPRRRQRKIISIPVVRHVV